MTGPKPTFFSNTNQARTDGGSNSGAERLTVTKFDNVNVVDGKEMNSKLYPRTKIKTCSDRVWRRPEKTQDWPHYFIGIDQYGKIEKKTNLSQDLKEKLYTCKDITKYFTFAASSEESAFARKGRPTKRKRAGSKEPQRKETTEDEAANSNNQTSQNQSDAEEEAAESSEQEESSADYSGYYV